MSSDRTRSDPLLKHRVIVLLTEEDLEALDRLRRLEDRSRSGMIRHALRRWATQEPSPTQRPRDHAADVGGKD